jgi:hypothetical protein
MHMHIRTCSELYMACADEKRQLQSQNQQLHQQLATKGSTTTTASSLLFPGGSSFGAADEAKFKSLYEAEHREHEIAKKRITELEKQVRTYITTGGKSTNAGPDGLIKRHSSKSGLALSTELRLPGLIFGASTGDCKAVMHGWGAYSVPPTSNGVAAVSLWRKGYLLLVSNDIASVLCFFDALPVCVKILYAFKSHHLIVLCVWVLLGRRGATI